MTPYTDDKPELQTGIWLHGGLTMALGIVMIAAIMTAILFPLTSTQA